MGKVFKLKLNHLYINCGPKYCVKFETQYNWDLFIDRNEFTYCSCPDDDDNFKCVCNEQKNYIKRYNIPEDRDFGKNTENIYCEIKPLLGDDYPCVLRKMNTQIKLTDNFISLENDKIKISHEKDRRYFKSYEGYKFALQESIIKPNYILLVKDFASSTTTKEQLIEIFQQSNIKVIFLKDIIENDNTKIQEYTNEDNINELKEKVIKLEEENKMLKEKIKHYENN